MKPVVGSFAEVVHLVMKARHLFREAVLTSKCSIDALAVAINASMQTQYRRHYITDGRAAAVGGLLLLRTRLGFISCSHDKFIMPCDQELSKELGR